MNTGSQDEKQFLDDITKIRKSLESFEAHLIEYDERKTIALEKTANYINILAYALSCTLENQGDRVNIQNVLKEFSNEKK